MNKLFWCIVMVAVTADARVEWKRKAVALEVHPTQPSADAVFEFTNTGNEAVSFYRIETGCGCLAAKPLKPSYAPGEAGVLVVELNLRNRYGQLCKKIVAHTRDGRKTELTVSADIPRPYTLRSPLVNWDAGDDAPEKRVMLRNPNTMPIKLLSIESSSELLPAELNIIREDFEYEVVVYRKPGAENARAVIEIQTEPPPAMAESKVIRLYVSAK